MPKKRKVKIEQLVELIMEDGPLKDLLSEIGVFIVDYNGKRVVTNDIWKDLDYAESHLYERSWTQFLHPEDRKRVEANMRELFDG
jgi:hypothetical protein